MLYSRAISGPSIRGSAATAEQLEGDHEDEESDRSQHGQDHAYAGRGQGGDREVADEALGDGEDDGTHRAIRSRVGIRQKVFGARAESRIGSRERDGSAEMR